MAAWLAWASSQHAGLGNHASHIHAGFQESVSQAVKVEATELLGPLESTELVTPATFYRSKLVRFLTDSGIPEKK